MHWHEMCIVCIHSTSSSKACNIIVVPWILKQSMNKIYHMEGNRNIYYFFVDRGLMNDDIQFILVGDAVICKEV